MMYSHASAVQLLIDEFPDWFGTDPEHPVFRAAVLLLVGLGRRKHLDDMCRKTGYPREFVREVIHNLRVSGTWEGEHKRTRANWDKQPFEFILDAMVGAGILVRVPDAPEPTFDRKS